MTSEPERSWNALVGSERPPGSPVAAVDALEALRVLHDSWMAAAGFAEADLVADMDIVAAAADEIERLREALGRIVESGAYPEASIASDALKATEATQ